jgi:hypothetical protein
MPALRSYLSTHLARDDMPENALHTAHAAHPQRSHALPRSGKAVGAGGGVAAGGKTIPCALINIRFFSAV